MLTKWPAARTAIRRGRQTRGRLQLRGVHGSGLAPARVISAVKAAAVSRPSPEEKAWIERIELLRALMLTSPLPLTITDYGAGKANTLESARGDATMTATVSVRTLSEMAGASKKPHWAYLLFRLIRAVQPATCIEMGACVGVSASYQAAALALNDKGALITLEGADSLAERTERTLTELGLGGRASVRAGQFADTLEGALIDMSPLDYAFIDGHHTESATIGYMEAMMPHLAAEAVLVFDDIDWSAGMRNAWSTIVGDQRFALTVDLGTIGIAVISASSTERQTLKISYA